MRLHIAWVALLAASSTAGLVAGGCGSGGGNSTFDNGDGGTESGTDDAGPLYDDVSIDPPQATVGVTLGGTAEQVFKAFGTSHGVRTDVSSTCVWSVVDATFGRMDGPTFKALPRGGTTKVAATCGGVTGTADLALDLSGAVVAQGAPPNAPAVFGAAAPGTDATKKPAIEYPLDRAVLPLNLPAVQVQWTTAANDLFHVSFAAPHVAIDLYAKDADAKLPESVWSTVATSAAGLDLAVQVEGLVQASPAQRFQSAPVTVRMSHDRIDNTAIYYWASSEKDLMTQTFGATGAPAVVKDKCTSCHSLSRSGSRIAYSRCVNDDCSATSLAVGFLKYDTTAQAWKDTVNADDKAIIGAYATFSPVGYPFPDDTKSLAAVGMRTGALALYDPDTGAHVDSNLEAVSQHGADGKTHYAQMPDWSPDGHSLLFTTRPDNDASFIDIPAGSIATMSYSNDGGKHTFGEPATIVTAPQTIAGATYKNFFFPSFSPDGKLVVFNGAKDTWRNSTDALEPGARLLLTDPTGSFVVDLASVNGPGEVGNTWPHWAPNTEGDYLWVAFSTERPYGHLVTPATSPAPKDNQGHTQYKQIWIAAVEKAKLAASGAKGAADPSAPPVWLPGQNVKADNISPYWTLPTSAIPR